MIIGVLTPSLRTLRFYVDRFEDELNLLRYHDCCSAYNEGTMKEFIAEYSFYFYSSLAIRIKRGLEYEQMLFLKIIKVFQSIQS